MHDAVEKSKIIREHLPYLDIGQTQQFLNQHKKENETFLFGVGYDKTLFYIICNETHEIIGNLRLENNDVIIHFNGHILVLPYKKLSISSEWVIK